METLEKRDSLVTSLRKELELHPLSLTTLEKLQEDLKIFDPRASGLLPQAQLSHLLLKHEVPLQLPTVKVLFKRFSRPSDREWVCQYNVTGEPKKRPARPSPAPTKPETYYFPPSCTEESPKHKIKAYLSLVLRGTVLYLGRNNFNGLIQSLLPWAAHSYIPGNCCAWCHKALPIPAVRALGQCHDNAAHLHPEGSTGCQWEPEGAPSGLLDGIGGAEGHSWARRGVEQRWESPPVPNLCKAV